MNSRIFLAAALLIAAGSVLDAQRVRVREFHVQPLAAPDRGVHGDDAQPRVAANGVGANASRT
jgi:hypothetical protein